MRRGWAAALSVLWTGTALAQMPPAPPAPLPVPGAITAMTTQPCQTDRSATTDWPNLCRYYTANRSVYRAPPAVMIGDSITDFWLNLSPALFAGGVVDRGISGQTCAQMAARFYQDVVRLRPRVVHILCGTNDIAGNQGPVGPDQFANAILAMVDMARANDIAVVIGTIPPAGVFNWRGGYRPASEIVSLNAWLRALTQQRGLILADYYTALAGPDGAMKPGLSSDGVHPTAAGYAVMEPITRAALAQAALAQADRAPVKLAP
ncbi:GDSL-type esterase/lipase family protein [Novosphingobium sp.]|uniref:GDSL-type esterase/lipase family protein n=1 Tax=Novosphingobium sp. TaxID=1874826 RepID=UPI003D0A5EE3